MDYLANCDGILLLFDPVMEFERTEYYEYLRRALLTLSNRRHDRASRLPHRVAVLLLSSTTPMCTARLLQVAHTPPTSLTNSVPQINEGQARIFFRDLCTSTNNADLIMALLEHYFHPKRIKYFVTSSIGFYVDPATGRFDSSDFDNIVREGKYGQRSVRGRVRPINVIEPLLWLAQQRLAR